MKNEQDWIRAGLEQLRKEKPEVYQAYRDLAERTERPLYDVLIEALEAARPLLDGEDSLCND